MKVIVCDNYKKLSEVGAQIFIEQLNEKPDSVLGLATGSTPEGLYKKLSEAYKEGKVDFSCCSSFNLDEYCGIKREDPNSYYYFMNKNLFSKVNIDISKTHIPNGENTDAAEEIKRYEQQINQSGGIDLQLLGIGPNGHIGFNEPDDELSDKTHQVMLTKETIEANSRFFKSMDLVPKSAYTMGVGTIFRAKKIVIIASGKNKADAVSKMLSGKISTKCPASLLQLHPNVTLIVDKDAYNK